MGQICKFIFGGFCDWAHLPLLRFCQHTICTNDHICLEFGPVAQNDGSLLEINGFDSAGRANLRHRRRVVQQRLVKVCSMDDILGSSMPLLDLWHERRRTEEFAVFPPSKVDAFKDIRVLAHA